jgi:hypothetical protein
MYADCLEQSYYSISHWTANRFSCEAMLANERDENRRSLAKRNAAR